MTCEAKVIKDSVSVNGARLTTFQLRYWRAIHGEFMTHRVFSRNASSSRAIPVATMIEQVRTDPAGPIHWGANQPGMQAGAELNTWGKEAAQASWLYAAGNAANSAEKMMKLGLHKQVANRILEPFQYISVVVTATEWTNFFELRNHPDAQPEIQELAAAMKAAMDASRPTTLYADGWHLPYVSHDEYAVGRLDGSMLELVKASAARCARVSYLTHDGATPNVKKDLALYERLVGSVPLHASPIEHQAQPDIFVKEAKFGGYDGWQHPELHGNFKGWKQYRKTVEIETHKETQ